MSKCDICYKKPFHPDKHCCFNCAHDARTCNVWHTCGEDCPGWKERTLKNNLSEYAAYKKLGRVIDVKDAVLKQNAIYIEEILPDGYRCPACNTKHISKEEDYINIHKYCPECGQRIKVLPDLDKVLEEF